MTVSVEACLGHSNNKLHFLSFEIWHGLERKCRSLILLSITTLLQKGFTNRSKKVNVTLCRPLPLKVSRIIWMAPKGIFGLNLHWVTWNYEVPRDFNQIETSSNFINAFNKKEIACLLSWCEFSWYDKLKQFS